MSLQYFAVPESGGAGNEHINKQDPLPPANDGYMTKNQTVDWKSSYWSYLELSDQSNKQSNTGILYNHKIFMQQH